MKEKLNQDYKIFMYLNKDPKLYPISDKDLLGDSDSIIYKKGKKVK